MEFLMFSHSKTTYFQLYCDLPNNVIELNSNKTYFNKYFLEYKRS